MGIAKRLSATGAAVGLVAGGLLAFSAPANAAGTAECDPQTINHVNYAVCFLINAGNPSNSRWSYNGAAQTWANNLNNVKFACGATGPYWSVSVTFTDNTGHVVVGGSTGKCGGMAT